MCKPQSIVYTLNHTACIILLHALHGLQILISKINYSNNNSYRMANLSIHTLVGLFVVGRILLCHNCSVSFVF